MSYHLTIARMTIIKKDNREQVLVMIWRKRNAAMENNIDTPQKIKTRITT